MYSVTIHSKVKVTVDTTRCKFFKVDVFIQTIIFSCMQILYNKLAQLIIILIILHYMLLNDVLLVKRSRSQWTRYLHCLYGAMMVTYNSLEMHHFCMLYFYCNLFSERKSHVSMWDSYNACYTYIVTYLANGKAMYLSEIARMHAILLL